MRTIKIVQKINKTLEITGDTIISLKKQEKLRLQTMPAKALLLEKENENLN